MEALYASHDRKSCASTIESGSWHKRIMQTVLERVKQIVNFANEYTGGFIGGTVKDMILGIPDLLREQPPLDPNKGTLVFLPGIFCTTSSLRTIMNEAIKCGYNTRAIGLGLNFPSITSNATFVRRQIACLAAQVHKLKISDAPVKAETIVVIAFSMGSLVLRKALLDDPSIPISKGFLLAGPNNGSVLASNFPFVPSCAEAASDKFIATLNSRVDSRLIAISAENDKVVSLERSELRSPGQHIVINGADGHYSLIRDPSVITRILNTVNEHCSKEFRTRNL